MNKYISICFSKCASLIPTTNIILFHSFPDFSDNSFAMCKYLADKGYDTKYRFVWLVENKLSLHEVSALLNKYGIHSKVIKRVSVQGVWNFIRARYIFVTHGLFSAIKLTQHNDKMICLWHGMPFKYIGLSEGKGIVCSPNSNITIASSETFRKIMAEAFGFQLGCVLVTGQPRCDLLFERTDFFDDNHIDKSSFSSIGIWMPTYRKSIIGDIRTDGNYSEGNISFLTESQLYELDVFLKSSNKFLIIKIHPMDAIQNFKFHSFSNILIIFPKSFRSQLYPLLGSCDYLLTDYSSVFIDYDLLKRPIGFVMDDIEEYKHTRGFYFENIDDALPGPIINSFSSLLNFIDAPYYKPSKIQYNDFADNKSACRILEALNLK